MPLSEELRGEVIDFWGETFGYSFEDLRGVLAGEESEQNRDVLYLTRSGDRLGGTVLLTQSRSNPEFGLVGEVATAPEFRARGIATTLCATARDEFRASGGQALLLGTANPAAARVYTRLAWRKMAGCVVMACITGGDSPEGFLVDYFRDGGSVTVAPGTAAERVPMVPLLVTPHDWGVLDANVAFFSTRFVSRGADSYPRYDALVRPQARKVLPQEGRGAWFAARTDGGRLVGLSTARLDGPGGCQVDGFTHKSYLGAWEDLIRAAISWGVDHGAVRSRATVSVEDEDKRSHFEALGFSRVGSGDGFELAGRHVSSAVLEYEIGD